MTGFQAAKLYIIFDGQSMSLVNNMPGHLMPSFPKVPWQNRSQGGLSVTLLSGTVEHRINPYANAGRTTALFLVCPGYGDIKNELDSGATLYSNQVAYATAARAAGYDYIVSSTLCPSTDFTAPMETARLAANIALMNDASNAFDYVVDLANTAGLNEDPSGSAYYQDTVHWSSLGASTAATAFAPTVQALVDITFAL